MRSNREVHRFCRWLEQVEWLNQEQVRARFSLQPGQVAYNELSIDAVEGEKWILLQPGEAGDI
ncbi:MAG: hypothetical protein J1E42_08800 [Akkermansiaceae bacterium]|nr:hypothetical protein [Akkermansiaceae bacterium]